MDEPDDTPSHGDAAKEEPEDTHGYADSDLDELEGTPSHEDSDLDELEGTPSHEDSDMDELKHTPIQEDSDGEEHEHTPGHEDSDMGHEDSDMSHEDSDMEEPEHTPGHEDSDMEELEDTLGREDSNIEEPDDTLGQEDSDIEEPEDTLGHEDSDIEEPEDTLGQENSDIEEPQEMVDGEASAIDESKEERQNGGRVYSYFEKAYECPNCGKDFAYRKRFINHMEICAKKASAKSIKKSMNVVNIKQSMKVVKKHVTNTVGNKEVVWFKCDSCDEQFKTKSELNGHATSHSLDKPFPCIECGRRFSKREYLFRHINTHSEKKLYTCHVCSYEVCRTDRFKLHMQSHGILDPFKCSLCGLGFPGLKGLNKHLNSHNSSALDPGANTASYQKRGLCTFNCFDCGLTFDKAEQFRVHMKKHGIQEPYECSMCGDNFSSKLKLNKHLSNHNSILQAALDPPNTSVENGDDVDDKEAMSCGSDSDSDNHDDGFSDSHVSMKLKGNIDKLNIHMSDYDFENHKTVNKVKTSVKGNGNKVKTSVKGNGHNKGSNSSHLSTSTKEPESEESHLLSCKSCGLRFYGMEDRLEHMKNVHKKLFPCFKCGRSYTRKSNLNKHSCTIKHADRSYKCTTCEISFSNPKELDDHIMTHVTGLSSPADDADRLGRSSVDTYMPSPERLQHYSSHDGAASTEFPKKKKKKIKHKASLYMEGIDEVGSYVLQEELDGGISSSHMLDSNNFRSHYPKKKKKFKHKSESAMVEISDYGKEFSKKKAKVKHKMSLKVLEDFEDSNHQVTKKAKAKPKTSLQMLDLIEHELSKFQSNLSIPTINSREHEESEIEYEKLVVFEFMTMKPVLPEMDHSVHEAAYDVVKINDQISLKFFM